MLHLKNQADMFHVKQWPATQAALRYKLPRNEPRHLGSVHRRHSSTRLIRPTGPKNLLLQFLSVNTKQKVPALSQIETSLSRGGLQQGRRLCGREVPEAACHLGTSA